MYCMIPMSALPYEIHASASRAMKPSSATAIMTFQPLRGLAFVIAPPNDLPHERDQRRPGEQSELRAGRRVVRRAHGRIQRQRPAPAEPVNEKRADARDRPV